MAKGRKKQPKNLALLHGSYRADRDNPPILPQGVPKCPAWLNEAAKTEWDRLIPILHNCGCLSEVPGTILGVYCHLWGEIQDIAETIQKEGRVIMSKTGPRTNPLATLLTKYLAEYRHTAAALGVNPCRTILKPAEREDPLAKFLETRNNTEKEV